MAINTYQVQNILRTYGKQLSRSRKTAPTGRTRLAQAIADQVNISSDAKRRQVINKIAHEIILQLSSQNPQGRSPIETEALEQLSQEYGRELEVYETKDGRLLFTVLDDDRATIIEELSAEESDWLADRLNEITRGIVDQNMIS